MSGPATAQAASGLALRGVGADLGTTRALRDATLQVPRGTLLCVLGPNGAGKTTLLRALASLQPHRGEVAWEGRPLAAMPLRERARRVAYLPQGGTVSWPLPVRAIVSLGRLPHGRTLDGLLPADRAAVNAAMERADVAGLADRPATALSGGERARVLLARALAVEADLLLADEPVASLDPRHQLAIMGALREEAHRGRIVVAVLHDLALAARFADRILLLREGRVAGEGTPDAVFTDDRIAEVFGVSVVTQRRDGQILMVPWDVRPV